MNILEAVRSHAIATVISSAAHTREYAVVVRHGLLMFKTRYVSSGAAWTTWEHTPGIPERSFLSHDWVQYVGLDLGTDTVPIKAHE